jgi:hypothetical protein
MLKVNMDEINCDYEALRDNQDRDLGGSSQQQPQPRSERQMMVPETVSESVSESVKNNEEVLVDAEVTKDVKNTENTIIDASKANSFLKHYNQLTVQDLSKENVLIINALTNISNWNPKRELVASYNAIMNNVQRLSSSKNKIRQLKEEHQRLVDNRERINLEREKMTEITDIIEWEARMIDTGIDVKEAAQKIKEQEHKLKLCADEDGPIRSVMNSYKEYIDEANNFLEEKKIDSFFNIKDIVTGGDLHSKIKALERDLNDSLNKTSNLKVYLLKSQ